MSALLHVAHVVALAPTDSLPNPPAKSLPGMGSTFSDWISWAKYVAMFAGVMGLIACGIMMMIGRRNRAHLAAEGASGVVWTVAGISVASLAVGIVTAMMG